MMYLLFEKHKFTTSGLLDVFDRHAHGDPDLLDKLTSEMRIYKNAESDFGRAAAIRERSKVMPDQWNRFKLQNYDPINFETFEDHSHFILEESPPFLTSKEVEALRNDLAKISIQPSLDDIEDHLNFKDDDVGVNPMENENLNEDNVGQACDEETVAEYQTSMTPWC
ncbi:hypothetical protein RIF29_25531 [Crotalaria pallida]|uniref:Uncharacterized protein n=1 Tax=Crotalaria pallida TaxID=3830 RepID=A0AAN9I4B3_CROPI